MTVVFFSFILHRDPEEFIVLRPFRAGLGLISTRSGTLYIFGLFFRHMYALKKAYTKAGQVRWVLECVTVGKGPCPHGPGVQFHGHRELNGAERLEYSLQYLHREVAVANYSLSAADILLIFHGCAMPWSGFVQHCLPEPHSTPSGPCRPMAESHGLSTSGSKEESTASLQELLGPAVIVVLVRACPPVISSQSQSTTSPW